MKREIKLTTDGSKTLYIKELNESYHSLNGALNEANHVFIKNGMNLINDYEINILELGFGTGLNVLVTLDAFLQSESLQKVRYYTVEKYPLETSEIDVLNYGSLFDSEEVQQCFKKIHDCEWNEEVEIVPGFFLTKIHSDFFDLKNIDLPPVNLVYFDCFGSRVQPDLWEKELFELVTSKMTEGGLLTTYSSKGSVRRILENLGFIVEKKAGPPGKREMINAILSER